jgi:hypothetical protein
MKQCNADAAAKSLKGEDRKKFMSDCLSAKPAKAESKISMCNKQTAGLSGDARSKAQSECMKGPTTAAAPATAAPAAAAAPAKAAATPAPAKAAAAPAPAKAP